MASGRTIDADEVLEYRRGEFVISTDRDRLSLDVVHDFLTNCCWAKGIPREVVARSIKHSLCFGIYENSGAQVGFARVVSDFATVAYLGDVFVVESHRGRGLSKWLMESIMQHPAALDSFDSRRAQSLFTVWLYSGEGSGAIYGTSPSRCVPKILGK